MQALGTDPELRGASPSVGRVDMERNGRAVVRPPFARSEGAAWLAIHATRDDPAIRVDPIEQLGKDRWKVNRTR
jgi:hypothetical protein